MRMITADGVAFWVILSQAYGSYYKTVGKQQQK